MKLSTKSRYALEGLLYLAVYGENQPLSIKEIAVGIHVSPAYMEQIFIKLKKGGVVNTVRGAGGGFLLTCPQAQVSVSRVIQAVEGSTIPVRCVENLSACTSRVQQHCVSRRVWIRVSNAISDVADTLTLEMLRNQYIAESGGVSE